MATLQADFGDPMVMIRRKSKLLKECKFSSLYREDAVKIRQAIQGYFAACTYAGTGYLNSNELGELIYCQLNAEDKARCKELFIKKNPGASIAVCLKTIYEYLTERMPILDEKPIKKFEKDVGRKDEKRKSYQLHSVSTQPANKEDRYLFKFEIKDKATAPYLGYDLAKVNELKKDCLICNKPNHFAVQCSMYQGMNEMQRLNTVFEKNICKSCVLTSDHRAGQCELKNGCGFKVGKTGRCHLKHHISIHNASINAFNSNKNFRPKKGNTNGNTMRAQNVINKANNATINSVSESSSRNEPVVPENHSAKGEVVAFHAIPPRKYEVRSHANFTGVTQVNLHGSSSVQKTVKMFKNLFIGPNGIVTAYSVGDSAAEVTLVREDLRAALGIKGVPELLSLQWTDNTVHECIATKFDMIVQGVLDHSERIILRDCFAIDSLNLPPRTLDMNVIRNRFPYLKGVKFDSYFNEEPVMLIGSPHAFAIESIKQLIEGGEGNPVALESKLGVSVYGGHSRNHSAITEAQSLTASQIELQAENSRDGPKSENSRDAPKSENSRAAPNEEICENNKVSNEELHDLLVSFNSIDTLGIKQKDSHQTENERKAMEIIEEEMRILDDGSIEVPLIWNRKDKIIPRLENNFALAYKRQLSLEKGLSKKPSHLVAYNNNVKELIALGYMRQASDIDMNTEWENIWYLPMGLVVNNNKDPPKFRNVYDARSKYNGQSLNDLLLKGPDLLIELLTPLLRMRMNQIAFSADVQQMFHRMQICLRDQQCQRVLWREDHDKPMNTMILNAMAFGPNCSPFVSQFVKNWNADNWAQKYPEAAETIKKLTYMDDLITSEASIEKAVTIAKQCIEIFAHIKWNLISFQSNSIEFLQQLPEKYIKKDLIPLMQTEGVECTTKILGCSWNTREDCFVFQLDRNIFVKIVKEFQHKPTKRDQASTIARIFDALGLISHYVIRGKILLQRSWKLKLEWDDQIPNDLCELWNHWLADIEQVANLKIPRIYAKICDMKAAESIQLHIFCDAGAEAFGCVAYFVVTAHGATSSSLIMAKAKVTPVRYNTETEVKEIPRLELLSALLAVRMGRTIIQAFYDLKFETFYWSDSEIVLRWILNPNHRLLKFAIGPIEEILELTQRKQWRYVPSSLNPADICTKFKKINFADNQSIWNIGPSFIRESDTQWPTLPQKLYIDEIAIVQNVYLKQLNYSTHKLPQIFCPLANDRFVERFSGSILATWSKLRRATARALKLYTNGIVPLIEADLCFS